MTRLRAIVATFAILVGGLGLSAGATEASVPRGRYYGYAFTWHSHDYCAWYYFNGSRYRPRPPYELCDRRV